jgi:hypothetical protein
MRVEGAIERGILDEVDESSGSAALRSWRTAFARPSGRSCARGAWWRDRYLGEFCPVGFKLRIPGGLTTFPIPTSPELSNKTRTAHQPVIVSLISITSLLGKLSNHLSAAWLLAWPPRDSLLGAELANSSPQRQAV